MRTSPLFAVAFAFLLAPFAFADPAGDVAAYDAILATVEPGQTTIALGDMIVPVETVRRWRNKLAGVATTQSASQTGINKWTGGNVYYAFDASVSSAHQRAAVDAMGEWAGFANLTFTLDAGQPNYILIREVAGLGGGQAALGRVGPAQQFDIDPTAWNRGTLVHELGHTLGLIHEHQRGDGVNSRDNFVTIGAAVASNGNFILVPNSTSNGPYDFLSVMHYARDTFAPLGVDDITPKAGYTQFIDIMGKNPDRILSRGDRDGIALMYGAPTTAPTTVVTNTKDSGPGSLRTAIYKAFDLVTDTPSATPTITFQIPAVNGPNVNFSGGVFTIAPSDRLPAPGSRTTIDATTQTTFSGNTNPNGPEIVLNGSQQPALFPSGMALRLSGTNVTVKGLVINGCANQGIYIVGTGGTVASCYIGTNAAGTAAVANTFAGIEFAAGATNNHVGGTTAAERNVISGNTVQGIFIRGAGANGNVVSGNYIGTNATGTAALANGAAGVEIVVGASGNTIGGAAVGAGNLLSGNTTQGVKIADAGTTGNVIAGNVIGLNAAGTAALPNVFSGVGLFNGTTGNTIGGGNVISGNTLQGIYLTDAGTSNNTIAGNWIGLNTAGTARIANGTSGIEAGNGAPNNLIGGTTAAARNVISGNTERGVFFYNTSGNRVSGNYLGTNAAGTAAVGNINNGVEVQSGGTFNTIGGTAPGSGNVISGNVGRNVLIDFGGADNNVVAGNFIGLNAAGTAAIVNGGSGIQIWGGAKNNTIGGTSGGRNFICGSNGAGITVQDFGTNGNVIVGNSIGVAPSGAVVGNSAEGISLYLGPQGTIIGGSTPGAANLISGNALGIGLYDATTINTRISGNSIFGNSGLGIDFGGNGVTANDLGDGDPGPNNLQNFPVLATAVAGTATTITGTLNSSASTLFRIEFFEGPSAANAGQNFIGATSVTTDGSSAAFIDAAHGTLPLPAIVPAGHYVTATATDPNGNTSEFCAPLLVTAADADADGIPDAWMIAKFGHATGLAADKSRATDDADGDGMTNMQEFRAGTDPRNPASVFRLAPPLNAGADKTLSLTNLAGRTYRIDFSDSLATPTPWRILADQIPGTGSAITITDPGAAALPLRYYRAVVVP